MIRAYTSNRLQWLKTWYAGLRLLADPERLDEVFVLANALGNEDMSRAMITRAREDERGAQALRERFRLPSFSLRDLARHPEGSLGRTLHDLLAARELDPSSLPRQAAHNDEDYVRAHLIETHDHWHVVLGFGTDIAGELGVQAFYLAQLGGALPSVIITGGLLHGLLWDFADWMPRFQAVQRGWELGLRAKPLFGLRWEELWPLPLEEVRSQLGLPSDPQAS